VKDRKYLQWKIVLKTFKFMTNSTWCSHRPDDLTLLFKVATCTSLLRTYEHAMRNWNICGKPLNKPYMEGGKQGSHCFFLTIEPWVTKCNLFCV
jgi:hypothetical protein